MLKTKNCSKNGKYEYKKYHSSQSFVRTTRRTKTAYITKDMLLHKAKNANYFFQSRCIFVCSLCFIVTACALFTYLFHYAVWSYDHKTE